MEWEAIFNTSKFNEQVDAAKATITDFSSGMSIAGQEIDSALLNTTEDLAKMNKRLEDLRSEIQSTTSQMRGMAPGAEQQALKLKLTELREEYGDLKKYIDDANVAQARISQNPALGLHLINVAQLTDEYNTLRGQMSATTDDTIHDTLARKAEEAKQNIEEEIGALNELYNKLSDTSYIDEVEDAFERAKQVIADFLGKAGLIDDDVSAALFATTSEVQKAKQQLVYLQAQIKQTEKDLQGMEEGAGKDHLTQHLAELKEDYADLKKYVDDCTRAQKAMENPAFKKHTLALSELIEEYNKLKDTMAATPDGAAKDAIGKHVDELKAKIQQEAEVVDKLTNSLYKNQVSNITLRTELQKVKQQMLEMERAGLQNDEVYTQLQERFAELSQELRHVNAQARVLGSQTSSIQGVVQTMSGVSGAFSAAQGAIGLFTEKNEALNAVMLKVQSLMSITIGLQQVANMLAQDSYFRHVTLQKAQAVWQKMKEAAIVGQQVENAEQTKSLGLILRQTGARIRNTAATVASTVATVGLAGAIRAVGVAIKSIPVVGWILAGISALVGIVGALTSSARQAKKEQEELNEKIREMASEPVAAITKLSDQWDKLGDNLEAKKKFVTDNAAEFNKLGVSVKSVEDAERLLIANKSRFIAAQLEKAKAAAYFDKAKEKAKEYVEAEQALMEKNTRGRRNDVKEAQEELEKFIKVATDAENNASRMLSSLSSKTGATISEDNRKIIDSVIDSVASIESLSTAWGRLGNDINAKSRFVRTHKGEFDKLGLSIKNVTDAENALVKNKQAFIDAQINKAKAMAAFEIVKDAYKEVLNEQLELEKNGARLNSGFQLPGLTQQPQVQIPFLQQTEAEKNASRAMQQYLDLMQKVGQQTGKTATQTKTYSDRLNDIKQKYKEYYTLVNSGDEIAVSSAQDIYKDLLAQGTNYLEYLRNQRDAILKQAGGNTLSADAQEKVNTLTRAISEETTKTALSAFEASLSRGLESANGLVEALNVINELEKEIKNDGTDLEEAKQAAIDKAREDVQKQAEDAYREAVQEYNDYLEERISSYTSYIIKRNALLAAQEAAGTQAEKDVIEQQIKALDQQQKTSDVRAYDELKKEYASFTTAKEALDREYEEKKRVATLNNDQELLDKIEKDYKESLSKMASEFIESDVIGNALDNISELTLENIDSLVQQVKTKAAEMNISETDANLQAILKKLEELRGEVAGNKNPFSKLAKSVKDWKKALNDGNTAEVFSGISSGIDAVGQVFDATVDGLKQLGMAGDEQTQQLLGNISGMVSGAGQIAKGIATGNPIDIITGSISLCTNAIEAFDSESREAQRRIEELQKAEEKIRDVIEQINWEIENLVDGDKFNRMKQRIVEQEQLILNLEEELEEEQGKSGSKRDQDAIDAKTKELQDARNKLEEYKAELEGEITQTTATDLASELSSTVLDAIEQGLSGTALREKITQLVRKKILDAVVNGLSVKYLEPEIKKWVDKFDEFLSDDEITDEEAAILDEMMQGISQEYQNRLEQIRGYITGEGNNSVNSLSGAYKSAPQESIDLLAGQTNAVRIQQIQGIIIARNQLLHLANIDRNVSSILDRLGGPGGLRPVQNANANTAEVTVEQDMRAFGIIDY